MSASQYKSGKNTRNPCSYCCFMTPVDIFVGVLCQPLSICHMFVDSSISGELIPRKKSSVCKAIISRESPLG